MADQGIVGLQKGHAGQALNLLAGQLYFGREPATVQTLLGSCVAVTLWHPQQHFGGMCHFLLPQRRPGQADALDGRYGCDAVHWLVRALERCGTTPREYRAGLYGGADTMPDSVGVKLNIGERNIEMGWQLIEHYGFELCEVDVGDCVPRQVRMTLATGEVAMRRGQSHRPASCARAQPL